MTAAHETIKNMNHDDACRLIDALIERSRQAGYDSGYEDGQRDALSADAATVSSAHEFGQERDLGRSA